MLMYFTYILESLIVKKTYVGHTDNYNKRLLKHNSGKSTFTKRYKPWKIIYLEHFVSEVDAIKREKYFKSAAGRRWMKKNLFNEKNAEVVEW